MATKSTLSKKPSEMTSKEDEGYSHVDQSQTSLIYKQDLNKNLHRGSTNHIPNRYKNRPPSPATSATFAKRVKIVVRDPAVKPISNEEAL